MNGCNELIQADGDLLLEGRRRRRSARGKEQRNGLEPVHTCKAALKGNEDPKRLAVHYTTSQRYQENVFIEGSRPQYLEDLHTEAQEGLKIFQQEGQTRHEKHYYRYLMALSYGPVMSVSPQATYLSTIIPNAVLPASIEVIEIDRGSVRTVSKSSLASGELSVSPLIPRRSDGDDPQTDNSHDSIPTATLTSRSTWSKSPSSNTVISKVSSQIQSCEPCVSGSVAAREDAKTKQNCVRSLSVMKTKQPPAPPQRTNSLHKTGTFFTAVKSNGSSSAEISSSPVSPTQTSRNETGGATESNNSSPQKTPSEEGKFERTMSPSSGYSSQSGTPTLSPKGISPTSPDKQKKKPVKPERSGSRASSSAASPSSSLTSLSSSTSEPVNLDIFTCSTGLELLNIPPPPKVKAPCSPPPETWVHNRRCFELLCGPSSMSKVPQKSTHTWDNSVKQAGTQAEGSKEIGSDEKQSSTEKSFLAGLTKSQAKPEELLTTNPENLPKGQENRCYPSTKQKMEASAESLPPPPLEAPRLSPMTKPENPVSMSALVPPSCIVGRDSRKIEDLIPSEPSISAKPPITAPVAPPLPAENLIHGVNFRRPTSSANRDAKSKEFLVRHKSAPTPKEDANIPLVTPSLLQMVLSNPGPQNTPQKPIRKSLSLKYPPHAVKTSSVTLNTPSVRLQEAIRMKTAAMSSRDGLPSRLGVRSPPHSCVSEQGSLSPKSPERYDMHKSPASTASFIFSRSTKMVVMETAAASSPEAQASLKQSLAAELMQVSDKLKTGVISNGGLKSDKVPPPIAKKPSQGVKSPSQNRPACSAKIDFRPCENGLQLPPPEELQPHPGGSGEHGV
uniref:KIAA1522 n=1 Tax=Mola mola TaxID=94237 RepID=A0A3Q4BZA6_MOLML